MSEQTETPSDGGEGEATSAPDVSTGDVGGDVNVGGGAEAPAEGGETPADTGDGASEAPAESPADEAPDAAGG